MVRENEGVVKVELVRSGDTSSEVVVLIGNHPYYGSAAGLINACMMYNMSVFNALILVSPLRLPGY